MMRSCTGVVAAGLFSWLGAAGCASASDAAASTESAGRPAAAIQRPPVGGSRDANDYVQDTTHYQLRLVNKAELPTTLPAAPEGCTLLFHGGWLSLTATTWKQRDSVTYACPPGQPLAGDPNEVRSGSLSRRRGDTLDFRVFDTTRGMDMTSDLGVVRGDTVRTGIEGGSYAVMTYVRRVVRLNAHKRPR